MEDAKETKRIIETEGQKCLSIPMDIRTEESCRSVIDEVIREYGRVDVLVNNAAQQVLLKKCKDSV